MKYKVQYKTDKKGNQEARAFLEFIQMICSVEPVTREQRTVVKSVWKSMKIKS